MTPEQKAKNLKMFGHEDMELWYKGATAGPLPLGPKMLAMSLLSDSQEEINIGISEQARQHINMAKWIIFVKMESIKS